MTNKCDVEMADLLARGAATAQVLTLRPPQARQDRVRKLLAKNKADELTPAEAEELARYGELEHFSRNW